MGGGSSVATNAVNNLIQQSIDITNSYAQDCSSHAKNQQNIEITNCNATIIDGVNQGSSAIVNVSCLQSASTQSQISADVSLAMKQAAQSVVQNFGMPSKAQSNNFISSSIEVGVSVRNTYSDNCIVQLENSQNIVCRNSTNVIVTNINQNQTFNSITDCVSKTTSKSAAASQIKETISQTAVAKQENAFNLFFAVLLVVAIIFLLIYTSI